MFTPLRLDLFVKAGLFRIRLATVLRKALGLTLVGWISVAAVAQEKDHVWQDSIRAMISEHPMLAVQSLQIEFPSTLPKWPACKQPRAQIPKHGVPVGRVNLSLRCLEPRWLGSIQVTVSAKRSHLAASRALQAGSTIDVGEFVTVESEWSALPDDVATEPDQVLGRTLARSIAAGTPLTLNLLRQTSVIKTGERVRVQLSGSNFVVAGEGQSLQAGAVGEQIRIKMANGQAVSATVVRQGVVEVRVD
jgi:flagella basal body P-ring formation protein FlgA